MVHNGPQQHLPWVCTWTCLRPHRDRQEIAVVLDKCCNLFCKWKSIHNQLSNAWSFIVSQQHYSERRVWETTLSGFGLGVCLKRLASNGICFMYDHVKSNSPMTVSHVKNNPWFNALVLALRFLSHIAICYTHTHTQNQTLPWKGECFLIILD